MIDVNAEAEKTLSVFDGQVCYYYPDNFNSLPVVTFYTLTEHPSFSSDNTEDVQCGTIAVDVWAGDPAECGRMSVDVCSVMTADNWHREFSRDVRDDDSNVYHRTMRFTKYFYMDE